MMRVRILTEDVGDNVNDNHVDGEDDEYEEEDECDADEVDGYPVAPSHVFLAECFRIRSITTRC